jgi:hypothetical protein
MVIPALIERGVYRKDIAEQLGVHPKMAKACIDLLQSNLRVTFRGLWVDDVYDRPSRAHKLNRRSFAFSDGQR